MIVPDSNVFDNSDADGDGVVAFNEYDNDVLGLNIARWLAGDASGNHVQVTDAKVIRGEFVGDWFQEIEEVDELNVGDVFIIKIEVTNVGSETEEVFNLYDWDLSPQTHVEVIGTPSFCMYPFNLQPGESVTLIPFCLSEAFKAEEVGWVTMNVYGYGEYTFNFEIIAEEAVNFVGVVGNEPSEPYNNIEVRIDKILLDPEEKLSEGDLAHVNIADDLSECDVVWPVHKGDKVEVFAKAYDYDCGLTPYTIFVWIYSKDSPYDGYLKLVGGPDPKIVDVSYPSTCVNEWEGAIISVTVRNNGGSSSEGYISVSFPNDETILSVSGTGSEYNKLIPIGSPIWGKFGEMASVDPLVELQDFDWGAGEEHTITMTVTPNSGSDKIEFLVRAALKNDADGSYERDPTYSGDVDQQGWPVERHVIEVCSSQEVQFKGTVTNILYYISATTYSIQIDEVISDPTGNMDKGEMANVGVYWDSPAQVDSVEIGDGVEVYGSYTGYESGGHHVNLESSEHYLKNVGDNTPVRFIGEITGESTPISFYEFDVQVDEIISDPSGKLEVEETVSVWAHRSAFTIEAGVGDRVEVFGLYKGTFIDMDKIQLEDSAHFLEEQPYRWIKTDENAKFDCGSNDDYFTVSFYGDWLATQITIAAETGENLRSRCPVLSWLENPPAVSKYMRSLDASKGMIELWPNKYDETDGVKTYYRITTHTTEKDKFDRIAWISAAGDLVLLTGENKDFVMKVWGESTDDYYTSARIFGGTDRFNDGLLMNWEGNVTKFNFKEGDEINLDVPSGSITMKILELKWSLLNDRLFLERVKVDYEISMSNILSVPYYNQGSTGWCTMNSICMILRYNNVNWEPWEIAAEYDKARDGEGLDSSDITGGLEDKIKSKFGLDAETRIFYGWDSTEEIDQYIKDKVDDGQPVYMQFTREGHAIVAVGCNESHIFLHDPSGTITKGIFGKIDDYLIAVPILWDDFNQELVDGRLADLITTLTITTPIEQPKTQGSVYMLDYDYDGSKYGGLYFQNRNDDHDKGALRFNGTYPDGYRIVKIGDPSIERTPTKNDIMKLEYTVANPTSTQRDYAVKRSFINITTGVTVFSNSLNLNVPAYSTKKKLYEYGTEAAFLDHGDYTLLIELFDDADIELDSLRFAFEVCPEERIIKFSGYDWIVKDHREKPHGPGGNYWSNSEENVWVDAQGRLHLRITKEDDGKWYCAEVNTTEPLGYGEYVFYVTGRVDQMDKNVVLGLFNYLDDEHEIDIEICNGWVVNIDWCDWVPYWGNALFAVKPDIPCKSIKRFNMNLDDSPESEKGKSTHKFTWNSNSIFFKSIYGPHYTQPENSYIIHNWYTDENIPEPTGLKPHINLWLDKGNQPTNNKEVEIIIDRFEFREKEPWFEHPWFSGCDYDPPDITYDEENIDAPCFWGVHGYTWCTKTEGFFPVQESLFKFYNVVNEEGELDYNAYLYGSDNSDLEDASCEGWAEITVIQGNVWPGYNPNPHWHTPQPVAIKDNELYVDIWLNKGKSSSYLDRQTSSSDPTRDRIMYAIDIWLIEGDDCLKKGPKRLVLDLIFYLGDGDTSDTYWEPETDSGPIFHYQPEMEPQLTEGKWEHYNFDLTMYIDEAIEAARKKGVIYDKNKMKLCQAEMLIELRHAHANLTIGGFDLYYYPTSSKEMAITAFCPVDITIIDPEGCTINKQLNEIPSATYIETDINGDGDPDDIITIPDRKIGDYQIIVIPAPDAEPADTYTLEVSTGDTTTPLAENVPVSEIPAEPYIFKSDKIATYDHDGDGIVEDDIDDLVMATDAYLGFNTGSEYDHDGDGIVEDDIDDLVMATDAYLGFITCD
ncbi:MAG: hypothetical protein DRP88_04210 [Candidatus Neomarinimicrobiota bacterium]|nr:MAG: hypothetical protein DRP88_04210 [Candidatus Neomarinimicrobiota bacterium]